jgi:hypothetical protein
MRLSRCKNSVKLVMVDWARNECATIAGSDWRSERRTIRPLHVQAAASCAAVDAARTDTGRL